MQATPDDVLRRDEVLASLREHIRAGRMIKLPDFDPTVSRGSGDFALTTVGIEPNDFGGRVGPYRYQFEGEEDLLHLIVTRLDGEPLSVEEGRDVAGFLLPEVEPGLLWLRPGQASQHFYLAHDELVRD